MRFHPLRILAALALAGTFACALADQLKAFPSISVADGRSTTTITATILDSSGHPVQDGTRVVFSTTLGSFRDVYATTVSGIAQAILVAGSTPGVATVTAQPLTGGVGPSTIEYEFVANRSLLSSAREYIEIVAPEMMTYTVDSKMIGASGPGQKVALRYRDIHIDANDIQFNTQSYELRARKATLKIGKFEQTFDQLYIRLNLRTGYGTTTYHGHAPQFLALQGHWLGFAHELPDGTYSFAAPPERDRYGVVAIKGSSISPNKSIIPSNYFEFLDLNGSPSHITARRAIVFPSRQIQFQRAEIFVAETRIMRVPLYQVNLQQLGSPVITESMINVNDNQLQINYPYFLQLKPGLSQDLRFHTGDVSNRSGTSSAGAFMDYELKWNKGDDVDGTFAFRDVATGQFEVDLQQFMRLDARTNVSAQVGVPLNSGFYGSANISRQFDGFDSSLVGSASQTFRGLNVRSTDYAFNTETTPSKIKGTPFQLTYGVTASESANSLISAKQEASGITSTLRSSPIKLGAHGNLTTSLTASELTGENVAHGVSFLGSATLSEQIGKQLSTVFTYNFTRDGFNDKVVGEHQLSAQTYWSAGRFSLSLFGSKSLDLDRASLFGDLDYKISNLWRLRSSYTYDRYLSQEFLDYSVSISYHMGWREIGLVWSEVTKRFGIQILGATIN
jgi:invasin-like protein